MANQEVCSRCGGDRYIECPDCEGSGEVSNRYCTVTMRMPCTTCQKTGRIKCPECQGEGYIVPTNR